MLYLVSQTFILYTLVHLQKILKHNSKKKKKGTCRQYDIKIDNYGNEKRRIFFLVEALTKALNLNIASNAVSLHTKT